MPFWHPVFIFKEGDGSQVMIVSGNYHYL